jgi:hypothetical protein
LGGKPDFSYHWSNAFDSAEARRKLKGFLDAGLRHFIDLTDVGELKPYAELLAEKQAP